MQVRIGKELGIIAAEVHAEIELHLLGLPLQEGVRQLCHGASKQTPNSPNADRGKVTITISGHDTSGQWQSESRRIDESECTDEELDLIDAVWAAAESSERP